MWSNKIERDCNNHNNSLRHVKTVYSYSPDEFLESLKGNLLVTGGAEHKRRELLMKSIIRQRRTSYAPVIIFSESDALQEDVIQAAECGEIGELYVISNDFKEYDFFSDMHFTQIVDYFSDIASLKGYRDTSEINDFAGSFLNILSAQAEVKLASMRSFAKNTDTVIANIAGAGTEDYDMITATSHGGVNFRRLLNSTCKVFDDLTTPGCNTGFNLSTAIDKDCVVFINTGTVNFEYLGLYFLQEFKSILTKKFSLIFDDSIILNCKELLEFLDILKQRSNINVVVSYDNVLSLQSQNNVEHFKKQIILLDGDVPAADLQKILNGFGEYSHFSQGTTEGNTPHLLFSLKKSESKNIVTFTRPKVLLEEVRRNKAKAVLSGHNDAEILVVKEF